MFLPTNGAAADDEVTNGKAFPNVIEIPRTSGNKAAANRGRKDPGGGVAWKSVLREKTASANEKIGGGKGGTTLEDQDGTFVCWCNGRDKNALSTLVVSSYRVKTIGADCKREEGCNSAGLAAEPPSPPPLKYEPQSAFDPTASTGPGFELFEKGEGDRVAGVVTGPCSAVTESTAERYLIHGLAAGPNFVTLYDSNQCLHVVSLAAILDAGGILNTSLAPPAPCPATFTRVISDLTDDSIKAGEVKGSTPLDTAALENSPSQAATAAAAEAKTTLVNNDHGLVVADDAWRDSRPEAHSCTESHPPEEGLQLSVTWRDARTGSETPDEGELCAGSKSGSGKDRARLCFLPNQVRVNGGGVSGGDGVIAADVRSGRLALFTRHTTFVYSRLDRGAGGGGSSASKGQRDRAVPATAMGGWRAYLESPLVHGVLFGGTALVRVGEIFLGGVLRFCLLSTWYMSSKLSMNFVMQTCKATLKSMMTMTIET